MDNPRPIENALPLPIREDRLDGVTWLQFAMAASDYDYDEYRKWPPAVAYKGMEFARMSFNSDTRTIAYRQVLAIPYAI